MIEINYLWENLSKQDIDAFQQVLHITGNYLRLPKVSGDKFSLKSETLKKYGMIIEGKTRKCCNVGVCTGLH